MIKDLTVNLSLREAPDAAADFAVSMASTFNAHLAGVAFVYEPFVPALDMYGIPPDLIESQRLENQKAARDTIGRFEETARRNGLSFETRALDVTSAGAPDTFARLVRRFDLSVVAQPGPDEPGADTLFVEAALFNSGRPVLVVPYIQKTGLKADRAMVCWDGSRTAARAVADAMPLLTRAKSTELVTVSRGLGSADEIPGIDIGEHLARHGIKVELKQIAADDVDVASALLSHAADSSADIMVMGGYGHSRFREFVLGGTTKAVLAAMTVPTLMSH
jgi:nucleotide-binding universal stress UspA family protein